MSESAAVEQRKKRGLFARIALFLRQVVDELKKVVWPTRNELSTYFIVVVVFILAIMAFTGALDFVFNQIVNWVFV
ncbi:Preprotein translocase subunit secE [Actinomyces bovis]|uniref:Protein translocase subunit SecE n=1 Tax=Actinomyces bovis TaxID=1658 RepID=A0ABY1VLL2_9ACTO|nr:preprotein translocase subunit SecE [Actinomyces bovis]SPT52975.1 Preprotein translocase subunit secE [Actinomyces bovis]VEG55190.1 Preprotein translocase subunit secE [Actinomyces israelii]